MVAESVPTRFTLDPARADEFIEDLSAVENCFRHVAEKWNTTVGALSLFLASPEGLAIVAAAEIATAVHIRRQAQALLVDVAQSMVYIVREYSREERRIPFNNDLRSIKLVELRRANARRAGNLLLRLAHYNPPPIRSYTVNTAPHKEPTPPQGGTPKPRTSSLTSDASDFTLAPTVPPVVVVAALADAAPAIPAPAADTAAADTTAYHDHPPFNAAGGDAAPSQCGMLKRPPGHGDANATFPHPSVVGSTHTPTSTSPESASKIVEHFLIASPVCLRQSSA